MAGARLPIKAEGSLAGSPVRRAKANSSASAANTASGPSNRFRPRLLPAPGAARSGDLRSCSLKSTSAPLAGTATRLDLLNQPLLPPAVDEQPGDQRQQGHADHGVGRPDVGGVRTQIHGLSSVRGLL